MVIALNIIVIIYLNSYHICGEEVKENNDKIKGKKDEIKAGEEEIIAIEERIISELIPDLYKNYKDVVENTKEINSLRRVFKNDREFQVHVKKLKEVNGFKRHNLIIKESNRDNPVIYINNPVETKIPNAYLTLEEFKDLLTERIRKQRENFKKDNLVPKKHETKIMKGKRKKKLPTKLKLQKYPPSTTVTSQTESSKDLSKLITNIITMNTTHHNNSVVFKTTLTTKSNKNIYIKKKINNIFKNKAQNNDGNETKIITSITVATLLIKNYNNVTKNNIENTTITGEVLRTGFNSKKQAKSKLDKKEALEDEIVKKTTDNVTVDNVDATKPEVIGVKKNYSEENKQKTTEFVESNPQKDENVDNTPENVTEPSLETTTEYKDIQTPDLEANEQEISTLEENNPLGDEIEESNPTENTPEDITEQMEEETIDSEVVTEETTTTTVRTTRKRLSRPLVWMEER